MSEKTQIISTSICTDAYSISLVRPEQILALSWQYDHTLSPVSEIPDFHHVKKPKAWPSAERLYHLVYGQKFQVKKDHILIVLDATAPESLKHQLKRLKLPFHTLDSAKTYAHIFANLEKLGQALSETEHSTKIRSGLSARLKRIKRRALRLHKGSRPSFLYLNASGMTSGENSYVSHALTQAGGKNTIAKPKGFYTPSLEEFSRLSPDFVVISYFKEGYRSYSGKYARHPIIKRLLRRSHIIHIPGHVWNCASPLLLSASERFQQAININSISGKKEPKKTDEK